MDEPEGGNARKSDLAEIAKRLSGILTVPEATTALQRSLVWQTPAYQDMIKAFGDYTQTAFQGLAANFGDVFARFNSDVNQETWKRFSTVFAEAMERSDNALQRVELLAELGWTLPMEMSMPQFNDLVLRDGLTADFVDDWFTEYYSCNEAAEYNGLQERLQSSEGVAFWRPLLEQTFRAYSRGEYALCVPSLLLTFEGSIAVRWDVAFQNDKNRRAFFERKISAAVAGSVDQYLWKSVSTFVDKVFESSVSPNRDHPLLKRNLILHGKSDPSKWDQADCLRLLQSMSSVLHLMEFELDAQARG